MIVDNFHVVAVAIAPDKANAPLIILCHNAVFDASTLILIAKVELLDLFPARIDLEVAVPGEVAREAAFAFTSA